MKVRPNNYEANEGEMFMTALGNAIETRRITLLVLVSVIVTVGCGPTKEQQEQWAIEDCLEGNAAVNGMPTSVQEYEEARKYCRDVVQGKYR